MSKESILNVGMTIDQVFEYYRLLEKKFEKEENLVKKAKIGARMEAAEILLDATFGQTLMNEAGEIAQRVDTSYFDLTLLKSLLPPNQRKALEAVGGQMQITFIDSEASASAVSVEVVASNPKDRYNAREYKNPEFSELYKLLSRNFASNIPEAVKVYNKIAKKELMPSEAWLEIKILCDDENVGTNMRDRFEEHVAKKFMENPLKAYLTVKKYVKEWSDGEVGRFIEESIRSYARRDSVSFVEAGKMSRRLESPSNQTIVKWALNQDASGDVLKQYAETIPGKTNQAKIKNILSLICPTTREYIESHYGRRPYVEKGYPERK